MKNFSKSDYLKSEYNKINKLFLSNRFDLVIEKSKKIIKKNPEQIPFYNFLALSYKQQGKLFLAEEVLVSALKINPNNENVLVNLGATYRGLVEYDKSEKFLKKALSINPNNMSALINYANLKRDINHIDESIQFYKKAYAINNNNKTLIINLAGIYQIIGDFNSSRKLLENFLRENPNNALAHKLLSNVIKYEINEHHQTDMLSTLKKKLANKYDEATLCFAIAKSFEDQKNYEKSFEFLKKANNLQKIIMKNYSIKNEIKLFDKIKEVFNNTDFKKFSQYKNDYKKLIFIVGLPRSGTTLAHQILAAHSQIYGAGEVVIFDQFMTKNIKNNDFTAIFENYSMNNDKKIEDIIKTYFLKINFIKTEKNILLDKHPLNFQWLGFIKILFPDAKIIHCVRDLKDTAISIYKNVFHINSIVWSNSEEDIVQYISLYLDLMSFWEKKIPNTIYKLNYEKLIENPKHQIQKLVKFCELDWEEDCLNFNEKATPIKTVSITQARQAIYKTSKNSHSKYSDYSEMFNKIENLEKNYLK